MRYSSLLGLLWLSGSAVACVGASADSTDPVTESASSALSITKETATVFAGTFAESGSLITFEGRLDRPTRASMTVVVNGMTLEAFIDKDSKQLFLDGHNGSLTRTDLDALAACFAALELRYKSTIETSPPHMRIVFKHIEYFSEASTTFTFTANTKPIPDQVGESPDMGPVPVRGPGEPLGESTATTPVATGGEALHQAGGGNGVSNVSCGGSATFSHDANGHCMQSWSEACGKTAPSCKGRCGAGCGWAINCGNYKKDCFDHDWCGYYHGDSSCDDEYDEARDDYVLGWCNCW